MDIAMCRHDDCPRAKECYRVQELKRIQKRGYEAAVSMFSPQEKPCGYFIKDKEARRGGGR